jgi:hypothetical protein
MRYPPGFSPEWQKQLTPADFQLIARTADELGCDVISVPEHIVMPNDLSPMMGAFWPHAFTVMSFIAGATARIKVNSCVIVLPHHEPLALAKAVGTLDLLTGSRVMLTFGIVLQAAPMRVRESDHSLLDPESPQEGFTGGSGRDRRHRPARRARGHLDGHPKTGRSCRLEDRAPCLGG